METQSIQRRQRHIVATTVALASMPMGAIAMGHIMADLRENVLVVGLCSGLLSYLMVLAVTRVTRTAHGAALACMAFTIGAAIINSPLSFIAVSIVDSPARNGLDILGGVVLATLIGAFITVPLGLFFGVVFMPLMGLTQRLSRDRAHEALDRTIRICGLWLAPVSLICGFTAFDLSLGVGDLLGVGSLALFFIATFAVVVSQVSLWARRNWIERVRSGVVPGWKLVHADEVTVSVSQLRPLFVTHPDMVLVKRKRDIGSGAYRTTEQLEPQALV